MKNFNKLPYIQCFYLLLVCPKQYTTIPLDIFQPSLEELGDHSFHCDDPAALEVQTLFQEAAGQDGTEDRKR